jgi:hypothetical protein
MKRPETQTPGWVKEDRMNEALGRLVQLYEEWGKPGEADRWRTELAARKAPPKNQINPAPKK